MKFRINKLAPVTAILIAAASSSSAATFILDDGGSGTQNATFNALPDANVTSGTAFVEQTTGAAPPSFAVGDSFTVGFSLAVTAASSSPIPFALNSLAFGIQDNTSMNAVGFTLQLGGANRRVRTGFDTSANSGGGNFSHGGAASGSNLEITTVSEQLLSVGDNADLVFTVLKTGEDAAGDSFDLTISYGTAGTSITQSVTSADGVSIDNLSNFITRIDDLEGVPDTDTATIELTNFSLNVVPEPSSALLLASGGLLGLLRRRRK